MTIVNSPPPRLQTTVKSYKNRASYDLRAALSIFRAAPVAHVAFVNPGDGLVKGETVMNLPLISVITRYPISEEEDDEWAGEGDGLTEDDYAVYLHTHKQSGLVEAIQRGMSSLTATTTIVDGLILSPTAHDHSLNYRSATLHLHSPVVLDDHSPTSHEEKRAALTSVTNTVTGYPRTGIVGVPTDPNVKRTTVVRCFIGELSAKQRYGAFNHGKEPVEEAPEGKEEDAFTGVVPCWTTWGAPLGYGVDRKEVEGVIEGRNRAGRMFAEGCAWASDSVSVDGLGRKRKP